jgi:hypothetical protein
MWKVTWAVLDTPTKGGDEDSSSTILKEPEYEMMRNAFT